MHSSQWHCRVSALCLQVAHRPSIPCGPPHSIDSLGPPPLKVTQGQLSPDDGEHVDAGWPVIQSRKGTVTLCRSCQTLLLFVAETHTHSSSAANKRDKSENSLQNTAYKLLTDEWNKVNKLLNIYMTVCPKSQLLI